MAGTFEPGCILELEQVYNFRDFGGYRAADGQRVRRGLLFRSGQHGEASDADLQRIEKLELTGLVDLRGVKERAANPCRRPLVFTAEIIAADRETADPAAAAAPSAPKPVPVRTAAEARAAMRDVYAGIPHAPVFRDLFTRYFALLAHTPGASLVHCMAGKDRTGVAVALVLSLLGVHRDDIFADYLASNDMPGREAWMARTEARYRRNGAFPGNKPFAEILGVRAEFLDAALATIAERNGSIDHYLADVLGINQVRRDALRARLLE